MLKEALAVFPELGQRLEDKRWCSGVVTRTESIQT
jgi:hypothetical protein